MKLRSRWQGRSDENRDQNRSAGKKVGKSTHSSLLQKRDSVSRGYGGLAFARRGGRGLVSLHHAVVEFSANSPSQRAMTAQARQLPITLTAVRAMSMSASIP